MPKKIKIKISAEDLKKRLNLKNGADGVDGERGSKFLGSVKNVKDLPVIDGIKIKEGDYILVETTGEIWYA